MFDIVLTAFLGIALAVVGWWLADQVVGVGPLGLLAAISIGALIARSVGRRNARRTAEAVARGAPARVVVAPPASAPAAPTTVAPTGRTVEQRLAALGSVYERGLISDEEYAAQRARILNGL